MQDSNEKRKEKPLLAFGTPASYGLATFIGIFGAMAFFPLAPLSMVLIDKAKGTKDLSGKKKWLTWGIFGVAAWIPLVFATAFMIPGEDPVEVATEEVVESVQEAVGLEKKSVDQIDSVQKETSKPDWINPISGNDLKWKTADCQHVPVDGDPSAPYSFSDYSDKVAFAERQQECHPSQVESSVAISQSQDADFSDTDTRNQYATTYGQFRQVGFGHGEAADKTRDFLIKNGFPYDALGNVNGNFRGGVKECFEEMRDPFCGRDSY